MNILSFDFPEGQWIHIEPAEEKWVIIGGVQTDRARFVFILLASFPTISSLHRSTLQPFQLSFEEDQIPSFFYLSKFLVKENELISVSHLAKIVRIIHQKTFGSNCFHHSFAAISVSRFPIVFIVWIVFFLKISALVNIGVRSALPAFFPCEKLSSLIRPIVVVVVLLFVLVVAVVFFFFCNSRYRRRLASHDFIFCWSTTSSISTRAALLALSKYIY